MGRSGDGGMPRDEDGARDAATRPAPRRGALVAGAVAVVLVLCALVLRAAPWSGDGDAVAADRAAGPSPDRATVGATTPRAGAGDDRGGTAPPGSGVGVPATGDDGTTGSSSATATTQAGSSSATPVPSAPATPTATGPGAIGVGDDAVASTTAVTGTPDAPVDGQSVEVRATVVAPGAAPPSGRVTFEDGGVVLGAAPTQAGTATLVTPALRAGTHAIVARFAGSAQAQPSVSPPWRFTITPVWWLPPPGPQYPNHYPQVIGPFVGTGPTIGLLGDSITYYDGPTFTARATSSGWSVSTTGLFGYALPFVKPWIDLYAAAAPKVMILNMGTNDVSGGPAGADGTALAYYRERMRQTAAAFPRSCFVVTTITTHRDAASMRGGSADAWNAEAASYNAYLRATFAHVADWDAVVAAHPDYLPDGVHPAGSAAGLAALGDLQLAAARACG